MVISLYALIALSVLTLLMGNGMHSAKIPTPYSTISTFVRPRMCHSASASLLAKVGRTQIIDEAVEAAKKILNETASSNYGSPTVVLLISDAKYHVRFEEMIRTWSHFVDRRSLVMVALDEATETFFQSRGVKTIRMFPDTLDTERSIREAVLRAKVEVPYVMLLKGLRVVMVEMDIYCRSNPLHLDKGTADVLVSEHNTNLEVNVGLWIAYPTCAVIHSFGRMYAWVMNPTRMNAYCDAAFDQKLMHFAWIGSGALSAGSHSACREFAQRDQVFNPFLDERVVLQRIPFERVMHWTNPSDPEAWPENPETICVHIWSGYGPPDAQIQYGYGHQWFPSVAEKEANIAIRHLHGNMER